MLPEKDISLIFPPYKKVPLVYVNIVFLLAEKSVRQNAKDELLAQAMLVQAHIKKTSYFASYDVHIHGRQKGTVTQIVNLQNYCSIQQKLKMNSNL